MVDLTRPRVVICDDDPTLRTVVSNLASEMGLDVIAETDNSNDASDLVKRFGAEVLVLDLVLPWGSGRDALVDVAKAQPGCAVVVFTAYVGDDDLLGMGAFAVIEKPDFDSLRVALNRVVVRAESDAKDAGDRRRVASDRELPVPEFVSVSGVEPPRSFREVLRRLDPTDVVLSLVITMPQIPGDADFARLVNDDERLTVARALRETLRTQDRITIDDDGLIVAVLIHGGRQGAESVFRRVERAHDPESVFERVERALGTAPRSVGVLTGGWASPDGVEPWAGTLARSLDAARRSCGSPVGERLWAG